MRAGLRCLVHFSLVTSLGLTATAFGGKPAEADFSVALPQVNAAFQLQTSQVHKLSLPNVPDVAFTASVPVDGEWLTLDMRPHSVRAPNYQVKAQLADGSWQDVPPTPVNTLDGEVLEIPGATVSGAILETGLVVLIRLPDGGTRWIEPLREHFINAQADDYVVYNGEDIVPSGKTCGVDEHTPNFVDEEGGFRTGDCGGLCIADLGCDADFEYYVSRGSTVSAVQNRINSVINTMNNQYVSQVGIRHQITTILVRTAEPDPYTSTSPSGLLSQFVAEWSNNQGAIVRDVAQLFTAKNIDGSVIGIANAIGSICFNSSSYCLVQSDCCGTFGCATDLSAHELGHLWSAVHCSSTCSSTMNSGLQCVNTFNNSNPSSITSIVNYRNGRPCLAPGNPPAPPGPFSTLVPANNSTEVGTNPTLTWSASSEADTYDVVLDDDASFNNPEARATGLTVTNYPLPTALEQNRTYYWKVTAFNFSGQAISNPNPSAFTTLRDCNGNGIDDSDDIAGGAAQDCNNNGIPDLCDIGNPLRAASLDLSPIYSASPQAFVFTSRPALGDVTLTIQASADLNLSSEQIDIDINGTPVGIAFGPGGADCPFFPPSSTTIMVPMATFNGAIGGGGPATINLVASATVDNVCNPASYVSVAVSYSATPAFADANGNQIPDVCETLPGDMNCDGNVNVLDINAFTLALSDPVAYAAAYPGCNILNGDLNGDGLVNVLDINPFVALLSGG
ncbi:Reprolysin (M12B) family zinc metalloprotease [Phycisphaerae bacterium RAS1]|nr:Reprolysin (M12B) family zinc metalloprotease [Phycisphaerae bacterium RAS1]